MKTKTSAEEIADLFDEIEVNLDKEEVNSNRSFEEKCKTVTSMMQAEEKTDRQIINEAVKNSELIDNRNAEVVDNDDESDEILPMESYEEEVEKDINHYSVDETEIEDESKPKKGSDLSLIKQIQEKYPHFILTDGSVSFREFYRYKVNLLGQILSRFAILDLDSIRDEINSININHFVGDRAISPGLIQQKLDESYRARARLSSILISILEQYPAWERWVEILRAKLWKDHELKGAHRRDGLTAEHLADVEFYVSSLKGMLEGAKHVEGILKSAADSLSRQLSCLQIKEATGFSHKLSGPQDDLDSIGHGETIKAPVSNGKASELNFGVEAEDDLLNL